MTDESKTVGEKGESQDDWQTWHNRGMALILEKKPREAADCFRRATALNLASYTSWLCLGSTHMLLREFKVAAEYLELALSVDAADEGAWRMRGDCLREMKCFEEAEACYGQALERKPQAELFDRRGLARFNLGRYADALADFDRALALEPDNPYYLCHRGDAYGHSRRFPEAMRDLEAALNIKKDYAQAKLVRGCVLACMGRPHEGLNSIGEAMELDPSCEAEAEEMIKDIVTAVIDKYGVMYF